MDRREFLKHTGVGMATLVVGSGMPWIFDNPAYAAAVPVQRVSLVITDALKDMVTHNAINDARCYFWIYKSVTPDLPPECPGPNIFVTQGDVIEVTVKNELDEPHAFYIPGMADTGPIKPGQTKTINVKAKKSGTYLYYDDLNAPVNRVMGLHGALIVMPRVPGKGHKFTPYDKPAPAIQKLFDDMGTEHWPGLAWEEGDANSVPSTPAFRQHIWLLHQASSVLFAEVGDYKPGADYPADQFVQSFLNDPYADTFNTGVFNKKAEYFTVNGQSGHFSHNNPFICPNHRVGEPTVIRVINAGLHSHSCHIHANHVFVLSLDGKMMKNPWWVDTMTAHPLTGFDWLVPYMRPPDVPNDLGIGLQHLEKMLISIPNPDIPGSVPHSCWPPSEELDTWIPARQGTSPMGIPNRVALDEFGNVIDLAVRQSPLCYPMHDHSEASQTSQGGNYNSGMISGINFIGDRNAPDPVTGITIPGNLVTFPDPPDPATPHETGPAAEPHFG